MNSRVAAAAAVITLAAAGGAQLLDANRPELRMVITEDAGASSECVIPDCRTLLGRGPWQEHQVDCLAVGPLGDEDGGARWRGCGVLPARFAIGSECLPARCSVVAGEDPLEALP